MALLADIRVFDSDDTPVSQHTLSFPVSVGRDQNCDVTIGDAQSGVSRRHAVFSLANDRLVLEDKSSNGTGYRGRLLRKGQHAYLPPSDTFDVRGFRIEYSVMEVEVAGAANLLARIVDRNRKEIERVGLDGGRLIVALHKQGLQFSLVPANAAASMSGHHVAHLSQADNHLELVRGPSWDKVAVTVNNYAVSQPVRHVHQMDVIAFDDFIIEIIPRSERVLRCHNPSCRLLNVHNVNCNCRWCGTRLSEAATVRLQT